MFVISQDLSQILKVCFKLSNSLSLPVDFHDDELGPAEDCEARDLLRVGQARLAEPPPVTLHIRVRDLAPADPPDLGRGHHSSLS